MEFHNIKPVYNKDSKILILGSFPSVKSREKEFFYAHPQNRFWKVISTITDYPLPKTVKEKKEMLLNSHIAVFDVIKSCDIVGSSDSSIKNVKVNDLNVIINNSNINNIFLNGGTAFKLFKKYNKDIDISYKKLPSTSPANARYSLDMLLAEWSEIKKYI